MALIGTGETEPPIFIICCRYQQLYYTHALNTFTEVTFPLYGIPSAPLVDSPLRTVEGIAASIVQTIRSTQATGPYRVVGWYFGGTLAYEVAIQLVGADQDVEFLGLINTYYHRGMENVLDKPMVLGGDIEGQLRLLTLTLGPEETDSVTDVPSSPIAASRIEASICTSRSESFVNCVPNYNQEPTHRSRYDTHMYRYALAATQYSAQPLPIPVHLFITDASVMDTSSDRGWSAVLPQAQLRICDLESTNDPTAKREVLPCLGRSLSRAVRSTSKQAIKKIRTAESPLFTMRSGPTGFIDCLFCVPGAGAGITSLIDLVMCLPVSWTVCALQPRGLNGTEVPHSRISPACEFYLKAIDEVHSRGKIHLLGHSFGGWIVFELAQRLLQSGRQVGTLILLDSAPPERADSPIREYDRTEMLLEKVSTLEQLVGHSLNITRDDLASRNDRAQIELLHSHLVRERILPRSSESEALFGPVRCFATALRTRYTPDGPYLGEVQLFLAKDETLTKDDNFTKHKGISDEWRYWAPNLTWRQAPGNHITMLKKPHVQGLVELFELLP